MRKIDKFYGSETPNEALQWMRNYEYVCDYGSWTEAERCDNMALRLREVAASWYNQLGQAANSWNALKRHFKEEFCVPRTSYLEAYYRMEHDERLAELTPLQQLWKVNEAADKAGIRYRTGQDLRRHVSRYIKVLRDPSVKAGLVGKVFNTMSELEQMIHLFEEQLGTNFEVLPSPRTRAVPRSADRSRELRPALKTTQAYWAHVEDSQQADDNGYQAEYDARSMDAEYRVRFETDPYVAQDEEGAEDDAYVAVGYPPTGRPTAGAPRGPPAQPRRTPTPAATAQPRRDGSQPPRARTPPATSQTAPTQAENRPIHATGPKCYGCGGLGHVIHDCPSRMHCDLCGASGHESESCWRKCVLCDQLHKQPGVCPILEELRDWYKTHGEAVDMPQNLKQQLN
jgi:hypothetical protein